MADWTISHVVRRVRDDRFLLWSWIVIVAGFIGGGGVLLFSNIMLAFVPVLVGCATAMVLLIFGSST